MVENIQHILKIAGAQDPEKYGPCANVFAKTLEQIQKDGLLPARIDEKDQTTENRQAHVYIHPHFSFDYDFFYVTRKGEDFPRSISPLEKILLTALVTNVNSTISKEVLQQLMSEYTRNEYFENDVEVYIKRLRKIIGWEGKEYKAGWRSPSPIITIRGKGYMLQDESLPKENGTGFKG